MNNLPLTLGILAALDTLATECPSPDVSQMRCALDNTPEFKTATQACKDADVAATQAWTDCRGL